MRWKNFLSYGNYWTEVALDAGEVTVISGKNGSGKCLRGSTKIDIKFIDSKTEEEFKRFINDRNKNK